MKKQKAFHKREGLGDGVVSILLFLASVSLHLRFLPGAIGWRDAAELCAAASSLGIAHPTGYPLYVLLGRFFCSLPVGDVAWRVACLSCLSQAVAAVLLFQLLRFARIPVLASVLSSLLLGSLSLFREKAIHCEVYPLFLLIGITGVWSLAMCPERPLWALLLGLACTAHLTMTLMIPGLLYWTWRERVLQKRPIQLVCAFCVGASLTLFLPIRSMGDPVQAWATVDRLLPLLGHLTGAAYHHRMEGLTLSRVVHQGSRLLQALAEGTALPLLLAPIAWIQCLRTQRSLALALVLIAAPLLLFYLAYDTTDISDFAPHAFPLVALGCALAGKGLAGIGDSRVRILFTAGSLVLVAMPFLVSPGGGGRHDLSTDRFFGPALRQVPRQGAVVSAGDNTTFYIWYARIVEGRRGDLLHLGLQGGKTVVHVSENAPTVLLDSLQGASWPQAVASLMSVGIPVFLEQGVQFPPGMGPQLGTIDAWWVVSAPGSLAGLTTGPALFRQRMDSLLLSCPLLSLNRDFSLHLGTLSNAAAHGLLDAGDMTGAREHLRWAVRVCPLLPELRHNLRYLEGWVSELDPTPFSKKARSIDS